MKENFINSKSRLVLIEICEKLSGQKDVSKLSTEKIKEILLKYSYSELKKAYSTIWFIQQSQKK